ncbi:hypothetical protein AQUCO_00600350v1 [Aquilegia coerulea]|uniref:Protein kinase domain-containing protein n=1 Tax=Aquilegia coerulea TaxID=218851 RepID=A0A2G5EPC4_AQUCA|nr:hypothetical protein AQUCO_00600350v1 [Aquilegia coerulea]
MNFTAFDPLTYLGNPSYRAPELLESRTVTRKVDIYSIGVLLFDIFDSCVTETERLPKISALMKGELPSSLEDEYGYVKDLLRRMVAQNADDRSCTTEILEALSSKKSV